MGSQKNKFNFNSQIKSKKLTKKTRYKIKEDIKFLLMLVAIFYYNNLYIICVIYNILKKIYDKYKNFHKK